MDTISFTIPDTSDDAVHIIINGRDLIGILHESELPFAVRESRTLPYDLEPHTLAGSYAGLPQSEVFLPSRHFLDEPAPAHMDEEGRTCILTCGGCREVGCWPFMARITVNEREVVWNDFLQPHRAPDSGSGEWLYDALNRFVFDREEYEQALRNPGTSG